MVFKVWPKIYQIDLNLGDGTAENPGVRWYFDSIGGIRK